MEVRQDNHVRGLFIARFQPIHKGHIKVIEEILNEVDELLVVIAAAQISHTLKNPLTAGERLEMVREALQEYGITLDKVWLLPAQDILDNALWVYHLKRLLPPFDIMFSNNPFTRNLFEETGFPTQQTDIYDRERYSATKIRERLISGESIEEAAMPTTIKLLETWNIRKRLLSIISDDQTTGKGAGTELTKGS